MDPYADLGMTAQQQHDGSGGYGKESRLPVEPTEASKMPIWSDRNEALPELKNELRSAH